MDRRAFIRTGTAALAAPALSAVAAQPAAKTPRVGVIGTGWFGMENLWRLAEVADIEVAALCDVDRQYLDLSAEAVVAQGRDEPAKFADFRDMLKAKNLDVVIVGSPDHWHPLHCIAALRSGADVYVEKPVSHTFAEGRAMVRAAREFDRVVQVGTHRRSSEHFRKAKEFVGEGNLGRVGHVRAFAYVSRGEDTTPDREPPPGLDWEFWVGPAEFRPFNPLLHPQGWRRFEEYSNGYLGDLGVHMLDLMRWIMQVGYPKTIHSAGGRLPGERKSNVTDNQVVTYDYGDFTAVWEHRTYGRPEHPGLGWGISFYGDKGTLSASFEGWKFEPRGGGKSVEVVGPKDADERDKDWKTTDRTPSRNTGTRGPGIRAHMTDFVECVRSRKRPVCDIEEGHLSSALCTLGTLSQRLGRSLTWDAEGERVVGDDEANAMLRREYRGEWEYPV